MIPLFSWLFVVNSSISFAYVSAYGGVAAAAATEQVIVEQVNRRANMDGQKGDCC